MSDNHRIHVQSIVSAADGRPLVQVRWGEQVGQFSPDEAREYALILLAAANAAETDAALLRFVREAGGADTQAAGLLAAFRRARGDSPDREDWRKAE